MKKIFISSEIIFQSISEKLLPEKIIYDNHEINCFDTFDNKFRKRIGLINIIPEKLKIIEEIKKNYIEFNFDDNNSYQILIRIPKEGEIQYSITNFDLFNETNFKKNVKMLKESKNELFNKLTKFHTDFNSFIQTSEKEINNIDLQINQLYAEYKLINNSLGDYYENYLNYNNFEDIDLELFHLMFYCKQFLQILKIYNEIPKDLNAQKENSIILNIEYEKNVSQIKLLKNNIKEKISFIKIYNKHYLNSFISGGEIYYISILNIEEAKESNPYIKALNFIKNIIIELKEESRLFEILLYLDSEVIKNLLIKNNNSSICYEDIYNNKIIKRNDENPTEYGLNMLNIDEIKNNLYNLIPKFIIRIETDMKFNENYEPKTNIITINEKRLLKKKSIILDNEFKKNIDNEHYVLPIICEILHELYDNGKLRLINNNENSPLEYRDSKYNYKRCKIKKKIKVSDLNEVNYPESGIVFENYISEKRSIIKWLKTIHFHNEEKKIMDVSLWVDKNFNKLEEIINEFIQNKNNNNDFLYGISIDENDDSLEDSDSYDCGFLTYN